MAEPVMKLYTEATDGSSIETKESALVWKYRDADSGFGFAQAKEMLDHLEGVLANEPVAVKSGQFIVEVKPQACIIIFEINTANILLYVSVMVTSMKPLNCLKMDRKEMDRLSLAHSKSSNHSKTNIPVYSLRYL